MKRMTFKASQVLLAMCVMTRIVAAQEPQTAAPEGVTPVAAQGAVPTPKPQHRPLLSRRRSPRKGPRPKTPPQTPTHQERRQRRLPVRLTLSPRTPALYLQSRWIYRRRLRPPTLPTRRRNFSRVMRLA